MEQQLEAIEKLFTSGDYKARIETPESNQISIIIDYKGQEILRQSTEKGIVIDANSVKLFGNSILKRFVKLGLERQRELSEKSE